MGDAQYASYDSKGLMVDSVQISASGLLSLSGHAGSFDDDESLRPPTDDFTYYGVGIDIKSSSDLLPLSSLSSLLGDVQLDGRVRTGKTTDLGDAIDLQNAKISAPYGNVYLLGAVQRGSTQEPPPGTAIDIDLQPLSSDGGFLLSTGIYADDIRIAAYSFSMIGQVETGLNRRPVSLINSSIVASDVASESNILGVVPVDTLFLPSRSEAVIVSDSRVAVAGSLLVKGVSLMTTLYNSGIEVLGSEIRAGAGLNLDAYVGNALGQPTITQAYLIELDNQGFALPNRLTASDLIDNRPTLALTDDSGGYETYDAQSGSTWHYALIGSNSLREIYPETANESVLRYDETSYSRSYSYATPRSPVGDEFPIYYVGVNLKDSMIEVLNGEMAVAGRIEQMFTLEDLSLQGSTDGVKIDNTTIKASWVSPAR